MTVSGIEARRQHKIAERWTESIPPILRTDVKKERNWLSAAIEDELMGPCTVRLAAACAEAGYRSAWSVEIPWNSAQSIVDASRLSLEAETIEKLTREVCLGSCFLLVEDDQRFAIASDGDLYWMIAGDRRFVEAAIGNTIERQIEIFGEVARKYSEGSSLAGPRLTAVHTATIAAYEAYQRSGAVP